MKQLGLTFGRVAEAYDRLRPEFAPEAVDYALAKLEIAPGATVLGLAAGTGKLRRALRERTAAVVAVEPDDDMRAYVGGDARAGSPRVFQSQTLLSMPSSSATHSYGSTPDAPYPRSNESFGEAAGWRSSGATGSG